MITAPIERYIERYTTARYIARIYGGRDWEDIAQDMWLWQVPVSIMPRVCREMKARRDMWLTRWERRRDQRVSSIEGMESSLEGMDGSALQVEAMDLLQTIVTQVSLGDLTLLWAWAEKGKRGKRNPEGITQAEYAHAVRIINKLRGLLA